MSTSGPMERVLRGDLHDLPPLTSQVVRVFISSTFTDTKEERNMLMEKVYPKLKHLCLSKYSLEFQVVDMRWGVRDEAADDHMTSTLCREEISQCHLDSIGPNFVVLLGQRYGHQSIPAVIEAEEFVEVLAALESCSRDTTLLRRWYTRDNNAIKKVYLLQPVTSYVSNFLSSRPELRQQSQQEWGAVFTTLQELLREGSLISAQKGRLSADAARKYSVSVTEEEIEEGLFRSPGDANKHCLCFIRDITDMEKNLSHPLAWRYIDLQTGSDHVDEEAQRKLSELRDHRLTKRLNDSNINRSQVEWDPADGGITRHSHSQYLESFISRFEESLMSLVEQGVSRTPSVLQHTLYSEVIQHLHMAYERCKVFQGRQRELDRVQKKLHDASSGMMVIQGPSGSGKTSLMAKCAQQIPAWFVGRPTPAVVIRFLGTTPGSTTIRRTLQSICGQLSKIYKKNKTQSPSEAFNDVQHLFESYLCLASRKEPLVLFLDSLDQLSEQYNAHSLGWLPKTLPDHVFIIVSTLTEHNGILQRLTKRIDPNNIVSVPVLGEDLSLDVLRRWLVDQERTLTDAQLSIVKQAFHHCALPLYVKLVFEKVLSWRSYYPSDMTQVAYTIREVINNLFVQMERKHGVVVVRHALAYITASKGGLGENEMEDILSLDDTVLTDVFQYHVPPVRRFPVILWLRIKRDIKTYLVTREADGVRVVYWYHRQFIEAARSYFLADANFVLDVHSITADYWLGTWYNVDKPFIYTEHQRQKLKLNSCNASADRKVAQQSLIMSSQGQNVTYNLRKLNNLPYHLLCAGRTEELKRHCLFDYHWLLVKIKACSIQSVLQDLDMLLQTDMESKLLRNALTLAGPMLRHDPSTLGAEVLGRLLPFAKSYNVHMKRLTQQCYSKDGGLQDNALLPMQQCFGSLGGALMFTIEHADMSPLEKLLALSEDCLRLFVVTYDGALLVWDLRTGEVDKEIRLISDKTNFKFNVSSVSLDKRYFVLASAFHKDNNMAVIVDMEDEDIYSRVKLQRTYASIGFKDNYIVQKVNEQLLVVVLNKEASCFDVMTGQLLHDFGVIPACVSVSSDGELVFFHIKKTHLVQVHSLQRHTHLCQIELTGIPHAIVCNGASEKVYIVPQNSPVVETVDILHRQHGGYDAVKGAVIDMRKALQGKSLIQDVQLSPDEKYLLVRTNVDLLLWDLKKNLCFHHLNIPNHVRPKYRVSSFLCTITSDGESVVAAYDSFLVFWSVNKGKVERTLRAASGNLVSLLLTNNSPQVAITSAERSRIIQVWDILHAEEETTSPLGLSSACRYMEIADKRDYLAVRSYDPTETRVIDLATNRILVPPSGTFEAMQPRISNDGQYLILRTSHALQGAIKVWNSETGALVSTFKVSSLRLMNFAFSTDNMYLATHSETSPTQDVQLALWDFKSGIFLRTFQLAEGGISFICFADNDTKLVVLQQYPIIHDGAKCKLIIFDVGKGSPIHAVKNVLQDSAYVLDDTSEIVAVDASSAEYSLLIYDAHSLSLKRTLSCHGQPPVGRLSISADGTRAVDVELRVLSLESGKVLTQFSHHSNNLIKKNPQIWPKISKDGRHVVWVSVENAVVKVGSVATGEVTGRCYIHANPLSIKLSASGIVVVGTDDGHIMMLRLMDASDHDSVEEVTSAIMQRLEQTHSPSAQVNFLTDKNNAKRRTAINTPLAKPRSTLCHIL